MGLYTVAVEAQRAVLSQPRHEDCEAVRPWTCEDTAQAVTHGGGAVVCAYRSCNHTVSGTVIIWRDIKINNMERYK